MNMWSNKNGDFMKDLESGEKVFLVVVSRLMFTILVMVIVINSLYAIESVYGKQDINIEGPRSQNVFVQEVEAIEDMDILRTDKFTLVEKLIDKHDSYIKNLASDVDIGLTAEEIERELKKRDINSFTIKKVIEKIKKGKEL
jgi:hypothetical protein